MNDSWHLYLTQTSACLRRAHGWPRRHLEDHPECEWDGDDPASLRHLQIPAQRKRRPLHVYLGSSLTKWARVDLRLRDPRERQIAAQACLESNFGIAPVEWTCVPAPYRKHGGSVVCAMQRNLLEHLAQASRASGLELVSIKPFVQSVWNTFVRKMPPPATLVTIERDAFTIIVADRQDIALVNAYRYQGGPELVQRELRRLACGDSRDALRRIHVGGAATARHIARQGDVSFTLARKDTYLERDRYEDFRDLGFCDWRDA